MAFGALSSGISALNSFSKGMEVIGNNIANVNTVSFKSSRIKYSETFNQVLKQSAPSPASGDRSNVQASQVGLGVQVEGIVGQFHQGGLSSTNQLTDLAIQGEGFFLVEDPKTNTQYATRGGDFRIDDQGYLVTSGGMRVRGLTGGSIGYEVDVDANGKMNFVVNEDTQTGTIRPSEYDYIRLDYNVGDAEVYDEAFQSGGQKRNTVMYTNHLIGETSSGSTTWGSATLNGDGTIDTSSVVYGADAENPHRVGAFVFDDLDTPTEITGVTGWHAFMEDAVTNLKTLRNVSDQGSLSGVVTDAEIEQAVSSDFFYAMYGADIDANDAITLDGNAVRDLFADLSSGGELSWAANIDAAGTVESIMATFPQSLDEAKAVVSAVTREQTPELSRFSIDDEGGIVYFLNNGDSFSRGQIQLVDFNDKTALIREGQNLYSAFGAAGLKENPYGENTEGLQVAGTSGLGVIKQGALELSNVDLTNEFANMITTQRGFQAGSRIITVSDDILQEVVNLKR
ncbi:flagellar hook-basal body complex protein [Pelagicoccus sp. SDUM812005]|uniref:flagellar hook-basal body complex protein n=1 Tax=Pelagicoccus sp. SDUM812005 TaxID=3041257 RepID=UPI00280E2969|nr:flagellar hook-basal body complex protein [Pelagicoccus sp. SDUM812005]MDQ8182341.1 flagellar hook-basal body complex protein [Pelagicoccus sp. SDUM812005]